MRTTGEKTPQESTKMIIKLKNEGKPYKQIIATLNAGDFKTACGGPWTVPNLQNNLTCLAKKGVVKLLKRAAPKAKKPLPSSATKEAVKTLLLTPKSSNKPARRYVTVQLRIPIDINLGTLEFHVVSLGE